MGWTNRLAHWTGLLVVVVAFAVASARAAANDERDAFVSAYRCAVVEILATIQTGQPPENRFLILTMPDRVSAYAQCLFSPDSRQVYCEAASGFFETAQNGKRTIFLPAEDKEKLRRLGFLTDDSNGNFRRKFEATDSESLEVAADMMLGALYDVYGAKPNSPIESFAPILGRRRMLKSLSCPPVS
jgi:hypothetical protein